PMATVDESVRRILRVKVALGLFEHPYTAERDGPPTTAPADVELARQAAQESFVLLKNDAVDGKTVLPLGQEVKTIAVIGPLADAPWDMLGGWHGRGNGKDSVTLRAALNDYAGSHPIQVVYEKGCE